MGSIKDLKKVFLSIYAGGGGLKKTLEKGRFLLLRCRNQMLTEWLSALVAKLNAPEKFVKYSYHWKPLWTKINQNL